MATTLARCHQISRRSCGAMRDPAAHPNAVANSGISPSPCESSEGRRVMPRCSVQRTSTEEGLFTNQQQ